MSFIAMGQRGSLKIFLYQEDFLKLTALSPERVA